MRKHESEVWQHRCFRNCSEQMCEGKLGTAASDIMYEKPLICVMGKQLLQYLLKCALHLSSWRLKCYCSQRNSMGTDRENIAPGNVCIMKPNVRYRQKAIFSIKKCLPIQSVISSCSKNSKQPRWSALAILNKN